MPVRFWEVPKKTRGQRKGVQKQRRGDEEII
jgi:hypothetical protein